MDGEELPATGVARGDDGLALCLQTGASVACASVETRSRRRRNHHRSPDEFREVPTSSGTTDGDAPDGRGSDA